MKIFELKGEDWMKGLSIQSSHPTGGLFRTATFDPFERMGHMQPPKTADERGSGTIVTDINQILPYTDGTTPFAILLSNRNSSGKGAYRIDLSTGTVTDVSSVFHTNLGGSATANVQGAIMFKDQIVYDQDGVLRRTTKTPDTDTNIGSMGSGPFYYRKGVVAEGTLYYPNGNQVATVDNSWTLVTNAYALPSSFRMLQCDFDGDNIVIFADENQVNTAIDTAPAEDVIVRCQVRYWNRASGTATRIWDIQDSYLVGGAVLEGTTYAFGATGIWICSVNQSPKLLYRWTGTITDRPLSPYQITVANNSVEWIGGSGINARIYAYGNPLAGGKKIFYTPHIVHTSDYSGRALAYVGETFLASTTSTHLYQVDSNSTRNGATTTTATIQMDKPYTFEGIKVQLHTPLASGDSVSVAAHSNNGTTIISDTSSQTFAQIGAKTTLWFPRAAGSNNPATFEDLQLTVTAGQNAIVSKVAVYGTPIDERNVF